MDRLLGWEELRHLIPYSRQHVARLEKAGLFPQRVKVGARRVAWRESEIREWIAARERAEGTRLHAMIKFMS